jgi:hypothetical protein
VSDQANLSPAAAAAAVAARQEETPTLAQLAEQSLANDLSNRPALAASRTELLANQLRGNAPKEAELYAGILRGWLGEEG